MAQEAKGEKSIGIVTTYLLYCRGAPSVSSKIVRSFPFGFPVSIAQRSEQSIEIDGRRDYWYHISEGGCWVFGGYLLRAEPTPEGLFELKEGLVRCGACGGNTCSTNFRLFVIHGIYVWETYFSDYCEVETEPCLGTYVGKVTASGGGAIVISPPVHVAYYTPAGKAIAPGAKAAEPGRAQVFKTALRLMQRADRHGSFYSRAESPLTVRIAQSPIVSSATMSKRILL